MAKIINIKNEIHTVNAKRPKQAPPIQYYIDDNGCHICISHALDKDGYPRIHVEKDRRMSHYIYYLQTGEWPPKGMVMMHTCDNPQCINLAHLRLGTQRENMADMKAKERNQKQKAGIRCGLTIEQVKYIKFVGTETVKELSKKFGVKEQRIRKIKNNKIWKHVTADSIARYERVA